MITPHVLSSDAFWGELKRFFISAEDNIDHVYADNKGVPTIGIGYSLVQKISGVWQIRDNLDTQMNAIGKTVSTEDRSILQQIANALNESNISKATDLADSSDFSFEPMTDDQAKNLLPYVINDEYANGLKQRIGATLYNYYENSSEMVALLSIVYQGWTSAIPQELIDALNAGNRAEAWYTIRYAMNQSDVSWKATRRYKEANEFWLYNDTITENSAKEVMRMYTIHETNITSYEARFRRPAGVPAINDLAGIGASKNYLIDNFANGNAINGKVIVGAGLDSYAYLGENINDQLTGTKDKNDLIFGEKGNDTLDGSTGTDVMIGGDGNDTYKVDDSDDAIDEKAGEGKDFVESTATYTLPENVEDLTLTGKENINGTGNDLPNVIKGNTGNNKLEGGEGTDKLDGGGGTDEFYGGEGNDTLLGGSGNDKLDGGPGDDMLFGRGGTDTFIGGTGFDSYYVYNYTGGAQKLYNPRAVAHIDDEDGENGNGAIFTQTGQLKGGKRLKGEEGIYKDDSNNFYFWNGEDGSTLKIKCATGSDIAVNNFFNKKLEIYLEQEEEESASESSRELFRTAAITVSPIILDLDGDGVETTNINTGTFFDHDANGFAELTGWVSADDGLLVMDRDRNGTIDSGRELFGNATLLKNGTKAPHGFRALAELDSNRDGRIDANDAAYTQLRIWQDIDGDGYSSADELKTLPELGIQSINTGYTWADVTDANGNYIRELGTFTRFDGTTGSAADVWFNADKMYTLTNEWLDVSVEIAALPELAGSGTVYSLQQAMVGDASGHLKNLVEQFAAETDANVRHTLVTQILYAWAGVENIDPLSRASHSIYGNAIGDARKLATLEAFVGEPYLGTWCGGTHDPNPHGPASKYLLQAFDELAGNTYSQLMAQTHFKDLLNSITKTWNNDTNRFDWDVNETRDALQALYDADSDNAPLAMGEFADVLRVAGDGGKQALQTLREEGDLTSSDDFVRLLAVMGLNVKMGDASDNKLQGTNDEDALYGMAGNDDLYGNAGDDNLYGGPGNDYLQGGRGEDTLDGSAGNDSLVGGTDDYYNLVYGGGVGNDTYLFDRGSGQDTIFDHDKTVGNVDTILLNSDISPADVTLRRGTYVDWAGSRWLGNDLVLSINGTSDTLTVSKWFGKPWSADESDAYAYQVEQIQFRDGTAWDAESIKQLVLQGASGDDILMGYSTADTLSGFDGNDQLYGAEGSDTLYGGAGNDHLSGGMGFYYAYWNWNAWQYDDPIGNDILDGGAGNDYLDGKGGNDVLRGGEGSDYLSGGTGDDTLDGGAGNDYLSGGTYSYYSYTYGWYYGAEANGNDTYLFGRGSGQDAVVDYDKTAGNVDTILLNPDISPADVTLRHNGNDLVLTINGAPDKLTVFAWFADESGSYQVEHIQFGDGTVWDSATIKQMILLGSSGDDILIGFDKADTISGLEGNDQLYGRTGDDTLYGGAGYDSLYGEADNDFIFGDVGNDKLNGGTGDDELDGGQGHDNLYGGTGDDTLDGGIGFYGYSSGNDYLDGGTGNDTYLFGRYSDRDIICDYDTTVGNVDTILFDTSPENVTLRRNYDDLVLSINDTYNADTITIGNWFLNDAADYQIENIQFNDYDGTVWDVATIKQLVLQGTSGDDILIGYSTADAISGFDGNDQLYGRAGDDTLYGGAGYDSLYGETGNDTLDGADGNDYLEGGAGNDTYLFGRGFGEDVIYDHDTTAGNVDTILLNSDISPEDITLRRNYYSDELMYYDDLVLSINDTWDTLTASKWFADESGTYQVEQIQFADGTVLDVTTIKLLVLQGTPYDDMLIGYSSADVLDGGAGNDTLIGNKGNDTYVFGRGYGQDVITDADNTTGNTDIVVLAEDVLPSDVTLKRGGDDLFLRIIDTSDCLQIRGWFASDDNKVEHIQFADGSVWDTAAMNTIASTPTDTDDYLVGTPLADVIDGGGGNDEIYGLEGNDTLYGGTGADRINGGGGDNIIDGGAGNDLLYGQYGSDTIYGGAGNDYIAGGSGNFNELYGGDAIDTLRSGSSINIMDGGAGDDYIDGTDGENLYIVNRGSGFDYIDADFTLDDGYGGPVLTNGAVFFGEGITPDELSVQINSYTGGEGGVITIMNGGDGYGGSTQLAQVAIGIGDNEGMLISGSAIGGEGGYGGPVSVADLKVQDFFFAESEELLTLEQILARADRGIIGEQGGTGGDDSLLGSVANDEIYGYSGDDRIDGRDNEDWLYGDDGNDAISAGPGEDIVFGGYGDDVMAGCKGNDELYGESGNDVYCFNRGDGHDYIWSYPGISSGEIDTISFGVDIIPTDIAAYVNSYGEVVLTIIGTDDDIAVDWFDPNNGFTEYSDSGLARVQFIDENGSARIFDLAGIVQLLSSDLFDATPENPISLFTEATSSFERTGNANQAGGDYAVAYAQTGDLFAVPTYYYGDFGDDIINGRAGDDYIDAGEGDNIINAGDGNNEVIAGNGNDVINAGKGNDLILPGGGDNIVYAGAGDDVIIAGIGDDIINAGAGNDTLVGGGGNDTLAGGAGDDTYYYDIGYGMVTIDDLADASGGNRIVFGSNITPDDLSLAVEEGYLIITVGNNTEDRIRLTNFNPDDAYGLHAVDRYEFADGRALTYQQLIDKGFDFIGTEGEDIMIGSPRCEAGTSASDRINALGGDDVLVGGKGNDMLDGGSGNDTYLFNPGDGIDTIIDQAFINAGNVVQFGDGITLSDLTLSAEQNTLIIQVGQAGDALRLEGFNPDDVFGNRAVDAFRFADGTMVDYDQLLSMKGFSFTGTTGDEAIMGTSINDTFQGNAGNDTLFGGMGSDAYVFNPGDGVDTIDDAASPDQPNTLIFGAGITPADIHLDHDLANRELIINIGAHGDSVRLKNFEAADPYGPHAVDYFQFADGQVLTYSQLIDRGFDIIGTAGDDNLIGTATVDRISGNTGNDTLSGGTGNDALAGGLGDDTYLFNLGDGVDVIDDVAMAFAGNTLEFGPDITFCDISLAYAGDTMIIYIGDNGDEVLLRGFDPNAADTGPRAVQSFRFADGTTISYEELLGKTFVVQGDVGDDYLIGTNVGDRLSGFEGNDTLIGGVGYDALLGGTGDDMLIGGAGSDLYMFNLGDGVDTIDDMFTLAEGNMICFGDDITPADLTFVQNDGSLTIQYGNNGDAVTLLNFDQDGIAGSPVIKILEFADGTQMRPLNRPPVIVNPIPDQTSMEDAALSFTIPADTFADPDLGDSLTYCATLADGRALPSWLSFDPATMTFSGTPTNDDVGTLSLTVTATDTSEASASNNFNVTVANVNDTPVVANPIADQAALDDALFTFTVPASTFADVDLGDSLTYSATLADGTALPAWLTFNPVTMTFSGTPTDADVGTLSLKVTATDISGASASNNFNVTVVDVNDPPLVANSIADQSTLEDEAFSFTVPADTFADVDLGDSLTYSATLADGTALPAWLTFDPTTMTFSGTPANEDVGILNLKVTATDTAGAGVSDDFNVTVTNVNDAPAVANPLADQTTLEDAAFSFTVPANTFADVDLGDSLTYSATLADGTSLPAWLTFDPTTMTFSGTPANGDVGDLSLRVTATDTAGAGVSDDFNVTVTNVNDAPVVANPIADQTILEDALFSFTVPANTFGDVDLGDTLTYSAMLADGTALPSWLAFDPATMTFSGTPTNDDVGTLSLNVTATDTGGAGVSDTFNITVESTVVVTYGTNHGDFIFTGRDDDLIYALGGFDVVYSDGGDDTIYGGDGIDLLCGDGGNDVIYGEKDSDALFGGCGNDTLDGGSGVDVMLGGAGDDAYIVDNACDVVTEFCNQGTDTVLSSVTFTLGNNVENLTLTGTAAINGTGNALDNVLIGNSGKNKLTGGAGNDTLYGGAGNDFLIGGTGDDIYAFMQGYGQDTITDHDTSPGNSDSVQFGPVFNPIDLILVNNGKNLDIQINDSLDLLTVQNQNWGSANQVEVFEAGDGSQLLSSQVDLLIQAMAGFSAENGGMSWTELIDQKPVEVQQILTQYWQPPK